MRNISLLVSLLLLASCKTDQPLSLYPQNPHYFMFRGKPAIIISSSEHYGAVLNPAFDNLRYLNTLEKDGMNYTRLFTGSYFEKEGSFGIEKNNLAPAPGKALVPWKRSDVPGALCGGNKFDLDKWDENYFTRLRSYVSEAGKRGIIVEVTLFSSIYGYWDIQVWNPENNINIKDSLRKEDVQVIKNPEVLKYQENFVRKIVTELNKFDNVTWEIQNEPWCDHTITLDRITVERKNDIAENETQSWRKKVEIADQSSLEWQKKIASVIADEEKRLKFKHLIAQNYCNHFYSVPEADPNVSILNFHYAFPDAVDQNYDYSKVIGYDESGFAGSEDSTYRKEAWRFIIAGGGLFNNLDYSFAPGYEDGTAANKAPGGGSSELRKQLKVLSDFINSFDFTKMKPDTGIVIQNPDSDFRALSEPGKQYAIYIENGKQTSLTVALPSGEYKAEWISTLNGSVLKSENLSHKGGIIKLASPLFPVDIALIITSR